MYYANSSIRQVIKNLEKDYGKNVKMFFELDEDELTTIYLEKYDAFDEFIIKLRDEVELSKDDKVKALETFIAMHIMKIRFLYEESQDEDDGQIPESFKDSYDELSGNKVLNSESIISDVRQVKDAILKSINEIKYDKDFVKSHNFLLTTSLKNACFIIRSIINGNSDKLSFKEPIPPFARRVFYYAEDIKILNDEKVEMKKVISDFAYIFTEKEYSNEYYYRYKTCVSRVFYALMEDIIVDHSAGNDKIDKIINLLNSIEFCNFSLQDLEDLEKNILSVLKKIEQNKDTDIERVKKDKKSKKTENEKMKLNKGENSIVKKKINTKNDKLIVLYINQFFAGKGGEDMADYKIEVIDGVVGPGSSIQDSIGDTGKIVKTIICGDNYFLEHEEECLTYIQNIFEEIKPDLFIAGPAFNAGRYGMACGRISKLAYEMSIQAISGLYKENPGYENFKDFMHVVYTGISAVSMRDVILEIGKKVKDVLNENNFKKKSIIKYCQKSNEKLSLQSNKNLENFIIENKNNSMKLFRMYDKNHIIYDADPKYKQAYYTALKYLTKRAAFICGYNDFFHDLEKLFSVNDHNNLDIKQVFCLLNKTIKKRQSGFLGLFKKPIYKHKYIYCLIIEAAYILEVAGIFNFDELISELQFYNKISSKIKEWFNKYFNILFSKNIKCITEYAGNSKYQCLTATINNITNHIINIIRYESLSVFDISVIATMSAGKSTFINALLGNEIFPEANTACTAKVTSVYDNDTFNRITGLVMKSGKIMSALNNLGNDDLIKWNGDENIDRIIIEGNLDNITNSKKIVAIHDTPGTNFSGDETHKKITINFLENSNLEIILCLLNAEHLATNDEAIVLKELQQIRKKNEKLKIIFVINKIDVFDNEKESLTKTMEKIKHNLSKYDFINYDIIPVSAKAARLFKMALAGKYNRFTENEIDSFRKMLRKFSANCMANPISINTDSLLSNKYLSDEKIEIDNKDYLLNDIQKALYNTGFVNIEKIIENQIIDSDGGKR